MRKHALLPLALLLAAIAGPWIVGTPERVEARPQYRTAYLKLYPQQGRPTCLVCHVPKDADPKRPDTKGLNSYGLKVEAALGEKNVKDAERIRKALLEVGPFPGNEAGEH